MGKRKWIYENSIDNKERFVLGIEGDNPLVCIGVNPSTATPEKLDNTLIRVENRAFSLGYDSWIMINLYPQRATNPNDLHKNPSHYIHGKNMEKIMNCFNGGTPDIWAAWGTLIEKRPYLPYVLLCMYKVIEDVTYGSKWFTIGKRSAKGHPHHPLYLKNDLLMDSFNIVEYIKEVRDEK